MAALQVQEERDVRRVFEFLAGNVERQRREALAQELAAKKSAKAAGGGDDEVSVSSIEIAALEQEIRKRSNEENKITTGDLDNALRTLGRHCTKKQLEYMLWEVDENLDGVVDWDEFKAMYHRNVNDETGLEPFELFNIVQFMTYLPSLDKDFKPRITEDDTMSTLFARFGHDQRYGRVHVEKIMSKLFGAKLKAQKGEGVLSLDDYLKVASVRQYERKRSSLI